MPSDEGGSSTVSGLSDQAAIDRIVDLLTQAYALSGRLDRPLLAYLLDMALIEAARDGKTRFP